MREHSLSSGEFDRLAGSYGAPRLLEHVLDDTSFGPVGGRREAEVAMAVMRPNGKILLQTKGIYPAGVFRLPTGGIKHKEGIADALLRETAEETALEVRVRRFVATLRYYSRRRELVFRSYLFLLEETGGRLREEEPEEGITGWIEADAPGLADAAGRLRTCPDDWRVWGEFRALAIDALLLDLS